MKQIKFFAIIVLIYSLGISGCGANVVQIAASRATQTGTTTSTPLPTDTPLPTNTFTPLPTDTPIPTDTPSPTNTPTSLPASTPYVCNDPLGCVKIGPTDPIHLAYLLVVDGVNSSLGIDSQNGVEIAIDDMGGQILGHNIKFDGENGACSSRGGINAATKLVADPSIVAVIGTSCSSEARGGLPLLIDAGYVVISPSNTAPDLTDPTSPYRYYGYFRTSQNDITQGAAVADYAYNTLGVRSAATIQDGSLYADQLQQVFADDFTSLGGSITLQAEVTPGQTDMSALLRSIARGSPELIYFPVFLPEGGYIISQARTTVGLENTILMGADGLYIPDMMEAAGDALEGFKVSSPFVEGPAYDEFMSKYVAKFGTQPMNIFHAHAYDAFNIIKAAIEKVAVQESDGTVYIPRQALRDAVAETKDFQGLTGMLTCNENGDCANPIIGVYEYQSWQYPPELVWRSDHKSVP